MSSDITVVYLGCPFTFPLTPFIVQDILQPTTVSRGGGEEVGQEVGGDLEESPRQRRSKKHRDRGTSDGTHRKKYKSKRSAKEDHAL